MSIFRRQSHCQPSTNAPHGANKNQQQYYDPNVRFEPYNPNLQASPQANNQINHQQHNHQPAPPATPQTNPQVNPLSLYEGFKTLAQGEANSIVLYQHLTNHKRATDMQKEQLEAVIKSKKTAQHQLMRALGNLSVKQEHIGGGHFDNFKDSINYALLQEGALMGHLVKVYDGVEDPKLSKLISMLIYHKVADIAAVTAIGQMSL